MCLKITLFFIFLPTAITRNVPSVNVTKGTKPFICGLYEVPTDCVEPCLPTCDIPKRPSCVYTFCLGGCICEKGYIRETDNGKCVPIKSCINPGK